MRSDQGSRRARLAARHGAAQKTAGKWMAAVINLLPPKTPAGVTTWGTKEGTCQPSLSSRLSVPDAGRHLPAPRQVSRRPGGYASPRYSPGASLRRGSHRISQVRMSSSSAVRAHRDSVMQAMVSMRRRGGHRDVSYWINLAASSTRQPISVAHNGCHMVPRESEASRGPPGGKERSFLGNVPTHGPAAGDQQPWPKHASSSSRSGTTDCLVRDSDGLGGEGRQERASRGPVGSA